MKRIFSKTQWKKWGGSTLLLISLFTTVACQKARMTTVRYVPPAPTLVPQAPPPITPPPPQQPPPQQPPVVNTPPGKNRGPLEDPYIGKPSAPPGPVRPVLEVYNTPPAVFAPIASNEPPAPPSRQTEILWLDDPAYRPPNVLQFCRGVPCPPRPCENCGQNDGLDPFVQRPRAFDKLDVLFMIDTSASLYPQYERITQNLGRFVHALPEGTDLRFAVMTGHGPDAEAAVNGKVWFGKFWTYPTGQGEVADSAIIPAGKLDKASGTFSSSDSQTQTALTLENLAKWLLLKIKGGPGSSQIPHDRSSAQGEALLANLNQFLRNTFDQNSPANAPNSSQIFPRPDAALAVVFVTDENDICYDYATENILRQLNNQEPLFPNFAAGDGITDSNGILRDKPEHRSFMSESICRPGGRLLNYDTVADILRQRYHDPEDEIRPVILTGIMHVTNSKNSIPDLDPAQYPYAKDREMGHGYLNLIDLFGGEPIEINNDDFGTILGQIGDLSKFKLSFENSIPLTKDGSLVDLRRYNIDSIRPVIVKTSGETIEIPRKSDPKSSAQNYSIVATDIDDQNRPVHGNLLIERTYLESVNIGAGDTIQIYMQRR